MRRFSAAAATVAVAVAVAVAGCAPEQSTEPVRELDQADYDLVHPILEARCATLDCHGDPGRPFRMYAETGLRLRDDLRGLAITQEELALNVRSIAAVDPDDELLLSKPLAGGLAHEGGDLWLDPLDPQPTCVASWLDHRLDADACAEAAVEVALPPP